jgi:hypothetical protein
MPIDPDNDHEVAAIPGPPLRGSPRAAHYPSIPERPERGLAPEGRAPLTIVQSRGNDEPPPRPQKVAEEAETPSPHDADGAAQSSGAPR